MEKLRATVKRNLSLFSCLAWNEGYIKLGEIFGWPYRLIIHHDKERANFYHLQKDFDYFKQVVSHNKFDFG